MTHTTPETGPPEQPSPDRTSPRSEKTPRAAQLKPLVTKPLDLPLVSITGLFMIAFFTTLHFARGFFLPVVLGVLLTFLLEPPVRFLGRFRIPRSLAAALVLASLLGVFGLGVHQTMAPAQEWANEAPTKLRQVEKKVKRLLKPVEEVTEAARQVERLTQIQRDGNATPVEVNSTPSLSQSIFDGTQELLFHAGVVLILAFFLLSSGNLFLDKIVKMLPRKSDKANVIKIARYVRRDVSKHLLTITLINMALGLCVAAATYFIGMPNPLLWGVMATLLNFVPYLGAVVGATVLGAASLLTFDHPIAALSAPTIYLMLTAFEGSLVTPLVLGNRLELNPVVIFLGLFFWGTIWGIAGALLAVPLLLTLKIVCDHFEPLEPIGELLGR